MFDFQKEVVLNSLDDVKDFGATVRIDGMLYKKEYMGDVFKTVAVDGTPAKLVINVAEANAAVSNMMQFVIELGLDNDYRGDFGSVLYYFRKPVVVTLNKDTSAANVAKAFKKAGFVDYKLYEVEVSGDVVTLTMSDNYITVRKAEVKDVVCSSNCNENMEVTETAIVYNLKDAEVYTPNVVGFGTYEYMIHNLRLPTHANIRFASPAEVEMPVKGGKYTQFSFESTTIHTFFVLESGDNVPTFTSYLTKPVENTPVENTPAEPSEDVPAEE